MKDLPRPEPGVRLFRYGCLGVGIVYFMTAASILTRGIESSFAPFGIPPELLASAHYQDAMIWVYVHMMVLGGLIASVGWVGAPLKLRRWLSSGLLAAHIVYLYLDVRTSDTALGNGLYQGPQSIGPALMVAFATTVFAAQLIASRSARADSRLPSG